MVEKEGGRDKDWIQNGLKKIIYNKRKKGNNNVVRKSRNYISH